MKVLSIIGFVFVSLLSAPSLFANQPERNDSTADQTWDYVQVVAVGNDPVSLDVAIAPFNDCKTTSESARSKTCEQLHLIVKDSVVENRLKQLRKGDRIRITFVFGDKNQNVLKQFCLDTAPPVSTTARLSVLLGSALVCLLLSLLCTRSNPLKLTIGEDGRYSNSKFQIAIWFFVLLVTYISTLWIRMWFAGCDFIGGVNIPQNLLLISGMSVLTFSGAKAITTSKVADEKAKAGGNQDPKNSANATPDFFKDLTHNDGEAGVPSQLDFGDFQMLIITLIAVATYLVLTFHFLGTIETAKTVSLPDVDTTMLAAFGLGQGAYLTKKAAGNVGQS